MNGRALYRNYVKSKGFDCNEFIKVENDWEGVQNFYYRDSTGANRKILIDPSDMINWIIAKCRVELK